MNYWASSNIKQLMVLIQGIKNNQNSADQRGQQENPLTSINGLCHRLFMLTDYRYFNQTIIMKHLRVANRLSSEKVNRKAINSQVIGIQMQNLYGYFNSHKALYYDYFHACKKSSLTCSWSSIDQWSPRVLRLGIKDLQTCYWLDQSLQRVWLEDLQTICFCYPWQYREW